MFSLRTIGFLLDKLYTADSVDLALSSFDVAVYCFVLNYIILEGVPIFFCPTLTAVLQLNPAKQIVSCWSHH